MADLTAELTINGSSPTVDLRPVQQYLNSLDEEVVHELSPASLAMSMSIDDYPCDVSASQYSCPSLPSPYCGYVPAERLTHVPAGIEISEPTDLSRRLLHLGKCIVEQHSIRFHLQTQFERHTDANQRVEELRRDLEARIRQRDEAHRSIEQLQDRWHAYKQTIDEQAASLGSCTTSGQWNEI